MTTLPCTCLPYPKPTGKRMKWQEVYSQTTPSPAKEQKETPGTAWAEARNRSCKEHPNAALLARSCAASAVAFGRPHADPLQAVQTSTSMAATKIAVASRLQKREVGTAEYGLSCLQRVDLARACLFADLEILKQP